MTTNQLEDHGSAKKNGSQRIVYMIHFVKLALKRLSAIYVYKFPG